MPRPILYPQVPMLEGCRQALMRLIGCPLCRGVPSLMPCRGFCLNVAHGCLSSRGLEPEWGGYLGEGAQESPRWRRTLSKVGGHLNKERVA